MSRSFRCRLSRVVGLVVPEHKSNVLGHAFLPGARRAVVPHNNQPPTGHGEQTDGRTNEQVKADPKHVCVEQLHGHCAALRCAVTDGTRYLSAEPPIRGSRCGADCLSLCLSSRSHIHKVFGAVSCPRNGGGGTVVSLYPPVT